MNVLFRTAALVTLEALLSGSPAPAQVAPAPSPSPRPLTADQWRADLDTLEAEIPRMHGNAFHAVPESRLRAAMASLRGQIPTMNEDQILTGFARIVGMIQDGHNHIDITRGTNRHETYPLAIGWHPSGMFVERAAPEAAILAGGRLLSIDGRPADSVRELVLPLIPHDPGNTGKALTRLSEYMLDAHLLHGLGVTASASQAKFAVEKGGRRYEATVHASVFTRAFFYGPPPADWADARDASSPPALWRLHPDSMFWLMKLPEHHMLYVQINGVANSPHETLADFSGRITAAARDSSIGRLVLDLRWNDGGNNYLLKPLIVSLIRLPALDRRGHLVVLTGPRTFSAAQNLVNRLQNFTEALFIGGPTGENVNFYGDTKRFTLPKSGCEVALANLWWQDMDPRDKRTATFPEIAVEESFEDYVHNVDPAMDYIIGHEEIPTIEETVLAGLARNGYKGVIDAYRSFTTDPLHRYVADAFLEPKINTLGYTLLEQKRTDDAIIVFMLNTEEFPGSFNTWDSLGEAYAAAGRKEDAIRAYKESLRLNPTSRTGIEALSKLQR